MFQLKLEVRQQDIQRLESVTKKFNKRLNGRLATVMNRTARFTATYSVDEVVSRVVLKPAQVKNTGKKEHKKKQVFQSKKATARRLHAQVRVAKRNRYGLEKFAKAKQNSTGTTYQIEKSGGAKNAIGAFMGPKPNRKAAKLHGGVFKRIGRSRLPIARKKGPSVWGVFKKSRLKIKAKRFAKKQLKRETTAMIDKILREEGIFTNRSSVFTGGMDFM